MPTQYAEEFRDDVARVALNRSREFMLVQFANDLGIHPGGLARLRFGQGLAYS